MNPLSLEGENFDRNVDNFNKFLLGLVQNLEEVYQNINRDIAHLDNCINTPLLTSKPRTINPKLLASKTEEISANLPPEPIELKIEEIIQKSEEVYKKPVDPPARQTKPPTLPPPPAPTPPPIVSQPRPAGKPSEFPTSSRKGGGQQSNYQKAVRPASQQSRPGSAAQKKPENIPQRPAFGSRPPPPAQPVKANSKQTLPPPGPGTKAKGIPETKTKPMPAAQPPTHHISQPDPQEIVHQKVEIQNENEGKIANKPVTTHQAPVGTLSKADPENTRETLMTSLKVFAPRLEFESKVNEYLRFKVELRKMRKQLKNDQPYNSETKQLKHFLFKLHQHLTFRNPIILNRYRQSQKRGQIKESEDKEVIELQKMSNMINISVNEEISRSLMKAQWLESVLKLEKYDDENDKVSQIVSMTPGELRNYITASRGRILDLFQLWYYVDFFKQEEEKLVQIIQPSKKDLKVIESLIQDGRKFVQGLINMAGEAPPRKRGDGGDSEQISVPKIISKGGGSGDKSKRVSPSYMIKSIFGDGSMKKEHFVAMKVNNEMMIYEILRHLVAQAEKTDYYGSKTKNNQYLKLYLKYLKFLYEVVETNHRKAPIFLLKPEFQTFMQALR